MKFGKEFVSQMVPEWQPAYMDYDKLKKLLKALVRFKRNANPHTQNASGLKRKLTLYRAFSGLVSTPNRARYSGQMNPDIELGERVPILVNMEGNGEYKTEFRMTDEEGGEHELFFFRRLDDEFNKVDKFYKAKVEEVVQEAVMLNKQMDAFIAFRTKVDNPGGVESPEPTVTSDIASSAETLAASTPAGARTRNAQQHMEAKNEGGSSRAGQYEEEKEVQKVDNEEEDDSVATGARQSADGLVNTSIGIKLKAARPAPIEVLKGVKINNTLETPRSTIKGFLMAPNKTELKFSRENLNQVQAKLKRVFVEFYQKLRLLKSYSFLNVLAFSKIMKKYDKITSRNASKPYMKMVDNSYLVSSDEIMKLMGRVESTFIKHFMNANRAKGMAKLRPTAKRERHRLTFSAGFSAGCVLSLLVALIAIIRTRKILGSEGQIQYMENMFPLYSLFGFIALHMIMYAANMFYWTKYGVNHRFIFGFKQGTELGYKQVIFLAFSLGVLALLCVLGNLDMEVNSQTEDYNYKKELLPLFLLIAMIVVLVMPVNVFYRPARFFFLTSLFHCLAAPFYKVTLPDFFLGDQLTSQVQALRSIEFYICYYGWGDYKHRKNTCADSGIYKAFFFIVAVIPYASRLLQCLRRMFEEKSLEQGYNGIKYFLTILAVCLRTAYSIADKKEAWRVLAVISSAIAAIFCTYWDFVHDWGLLNRTSQNRWLRDKLLVPCKNVYFIAMILNVLLRFAWLQTVLNFQLPFTHKQTMIATVASLEIIRRGIWNFFRIENEHLNNVGKYRAFKSVPLPFNYDEVEDKDD